MKESLFALDKASPTLDHALDDARDRQPDMFSIRNIVRGQPAFKKRKLQDLKPIVAVQMNARLGKAKPIVLKALLDSGASATLIAQKYAKKLRLKNIKSKTVWSTPAGNLQTSQKTRTSFVIPELHDNRVIDWDLHVTPSLGNYDMIIGRDILQDLKIDILFSKQIVEWDDSQIPFKDADAPVEESFFIPDPEGVEDAAERMKRILDAKYEPADLEKVARNATHLNEEQQQKLYRTLKKYEDLFDGTLGTWHDNQYDIELRKDAKPYHAKAYPIPQAHLRTLQVEVERLCEVGVLKKVNRSEWAAPTFIIPKKDGSVRFISDFRELNKRIHRKPYPIPKIQDLLMKLEGFSFATSLDLNMGYYHIELTPNSKRLCTIVLPFGKYEYQRLPMGLCNSPDIFQEKMSDLMQGLEFVRAYIDDLLSITHGSFEDHLEKLELIFQRLQVAGLKVNCDKSFFARGELEYLGYWITRDGIQPVTKKVNAILALKEPKTRKELRSFIGMINYYRDMWIRRSHVLAPLTKLCTKEVKFVWGDEQQKAFDTIKRIISKQTLLAYPNFNKKFVIHTDASHTQLGAVISQDNKPIAFYSRKLNPAQTRYTTTERELLSIVETLKEFRNILLGQEIEIHTDHKNLTCKNFNTDRVMRWRLILEEYGPKLLYIKGEKNVVADALSRLDLSDDMPAQLTIERQSELFANDDEAGDYPLPYHRIFEEQNADEDLQDLYLRRDTHNKTSFVQSDKTYELITYQGRIVLPKSLQKEAVTWYHNLLLHPGETRTELTIAQHYYWKGMRADIKRVCSRCKTCQLTKKIIKKYGDVPPKTADARPWHTLCIDLIGPYTLKTVEDKNKKTTAKTVLHCLTMIDPATGWFEIAPVHNKEAYEIASALEQTWLSRYPWPTEVVLDRGREFMGECQRMLRCDYGIVRKPITARNPQANAMIERAHQTLGNLLRTQQLHNLDPVDYDEQIGGILAAVGFAMRATVHTTTRATPAQLVFSRDAVLNTRFEADWQYIKDRKQRLIIQNNKRENSRRTPHTYNVGDLVRVRQDPNRKFGADQFRGPYTIVQVYDNGTARLEHTTANGGVVTQTWNVRNLAPYEA